MIEKTKVPLGHLLTLSTSVPLCTNGQPGLLHLMVYLTQYPLRTHAFRAVMPICRHAVVRQHPWLLRISVPHQIIDTNDWPRLWAWLDAMEQRWGAEHEVGPAELVDWQANGHPRAPRVVDPVGEPIAFPFVNPVLIWEEPVFEAVQF